VMETLDAIGIGYSPLELRAAVRAGEMQRRYQDRLRRAAEPGTARRSVPDFLIGAHALLQCGGLITRDAGFFRDYFKGLKVIVPQA
jgi:predicted nucleic acid-binding protein